MCFSIACKGWMLNVTLYQNWYVHCRQFSVSCGRQRCEKRRHNIRNLSSWRIFNMTKEANMYVHLWPCAIWTYRIYIACILFSRPIANLRTIGVDMCVCVSLCYRIFQEYDNIKWWLQPVTAFVPFVYCYVITQPQRPVDSRFNGRKRFKNYVYQHLECIEVSQIEFRLFVKNPHQISFGYLFFIHRFLDVQ